MDKSKDVHAEQKALITVEKRTLRASAAAASVIAGLTALQGAAAAADTIAGGTQASDRLPEIEALANRIAGLYIELGDKIGDAHREIEAALIEAGANMASGGDKDALGELIRNIMP